MKLLQKGENLLLKGRNLYQYTRGIVDASYVGDLLESSTIIDEIADRARRYLTEVDRLCVAFERLEQHLENISEEAESEEN